MRVTKTIREYIEEQVKAKFNPRIDELRKAINDERQAANDFVKKCMEEYETDLDKLLDQHFPGFKYWGWRSDKKQNILQANTVNLNSHSESADPRQEEIRNLEKRRDDAIKNIIVTLELGGNKKDLEKLLAEIA